MGGRILVVFLPEEVAGGGLSLSSAQRRRRWVCILSPPRAGDVVPAFAEIEVRWAIHYDEVIAGNLGSEARVVRSSGAVNACAAWEITPRQCLAHRRGGAR